MSTPATDDEVIALFRRALAAAEQGDEKAEMVARWMLSMLIARAAERRVNTFH